MLKKHPQQGGFTIIEIAITLALLAIISMIGFPSVGELVREQGVRSRAERISDGLQTARLEAIQRNRSVTFSLDGLGYLITSIDFETGDEAVLHDFSATSADSPYVLASSHSSVSFNGTGRPSTSSFWINLGHSKSTCEHDGGTLRCLRILLTPRGSVRMCDPALVNATDPRAC